MSVALGAWEFNSAGYEGPTVDCRRRHGGDGSAVAALLAVVQSVSMGTNLLLRVMCVVLCPVLALAGYVAISSCECGCVDVSPFTVCCCDASSGAAAYTEGSDDCRTEMGQQKPPADAPPSSSLNPQVTATAAADVGVPNSIWAVKSDRGVERRSRLAPISSQAPRAPPLA